MGCTPIPTVTHVIIVYRFIYSVHVNSNVTHNYRQKYLNMNIRFYKIGFSLEVDISNINRQFEQIFQY